MAVSGDEIRLVLPADPIYGHIARIAMTRLALQCGLGRAATEDLRIAVDETLIFLLRPTEETDHDGATDATTDATGVTILFTVAPDRLTVDAISTGGDTVARRDDPARERFAEIVDDTVDAFSVDEQGRHVHLEKLRII